MDTKFVKLSNNIEVAYERTPDTPRVALYLIFR